MIEAASQEKVRTRQREFLGRPAEDPSQTPHSPSCTALFEAECTYAFSSCPAHSSSRPSAGLLSAQWKQRSQTAGDAQQSYGVAARKANSPLGLVGARRESLGHAAWNQPVHRRR